MVYYCIATFVVCVHLHDFAIDKNASRYCDGTFTRIINICAIRQGGRTENVFFKWVAEQKSFKSPVTECSLNLPAARKPFTLRLHVSRDLTAVSCAECVVLFAFVRVCLRPRRVLHGLLFFKLVQHASPFQSHPSTVFCESLSLWRGKGKLPYPVCQWSLEVAAVRSKSRAISCSVTSQIPSLLRVSSSREPE